MDFLFDGVIGDRLVYCGMGRIGINGRVLSNDSYFDGVVRVRDLGSKLFGGVIGVRGVTETSDLFDGEITVRGRQDFFFDGAVHVRSLLNVFAEGVIDVV
jgi:hypothetical protein